MSTQIGSAVGTPTRATLVEAIKDYSVGLGGGVVYNIATGITGSGFIGSLAGAALAGSVIKGQRGSTIATILGFQALTQNMAQPADAESNVM